ncbi:hypothetical protein ACOMHN_055505 [Nucella lapillus]
MEASIAVTAMTGALLPPPPSRLAHGALRAGLSVTSTQGRVAGTPLVTLHWLSGAHQRDEARTHCVVIQTARHVVHAVGQTRADRRDCLTTLETRRASLRQAQRVAEGDNPAQTVTQSSCPVDEIQSVKGEGEHGATEETEHTVTVSIQQEETENIEQRGTESIEEKETEIIEEKETEISIKQRETEFIEQRETEIIEQRETESTEERETESSQLKETDNIEQRGTEIIEERETEISTKDRETEFVQQKETEIIEQRETESIKDRETESIKDRETESGEERETESDCQRDTENRGVEISVNMDPQGETHGGGGGKPATAVAGLADDFFGPTSATTSENFTNGVRGGDSSECVLRIDEAIDSVEKQGSASRPRLGKEGSPEIIVDSVENVTLKDATSEKALLGNREDEGSSSSQRDSLSSRTDEDKRKSSSDMDMDFTVLELDSSHLNLEMSKQKTSLRKRGSLARRKKPSRESVTHMASDSSDTMFQDSTDSKPLTSPSSDMAEDEVFHKQARAAESQQTQPALSGGVRKAAQPFKPSLVMPGLQDLTQSKVGHLPQAVKVGHLPQPVQASPRWVTILSQSKVGGSPTSASPRWVTYLRQSKVGHLPQPVQGGSPTSGSPWWVTYLSQSKVGHLPQPVQGGSPTSASPRWVTSPRPRWVTYLRQSKVGHLTQSKVGGSPQPVHGRSPHPVQGGSPQPVQGGSPQPVQGGWVTYLSQSKVGHLPQAVQGGSPISASPRWVTYLSQSKVGHLTQAKVGHLPQPVQGGSPTSASPRWVTYLSQSKVGHLTQSKVGHLSQSKVGHLSQSKLFNQERNKSDEGQSPPVRSPKSPLSPSHRPNPPPPLVLPKPTSKVQKDSQNKTIAAENSTAHASPDAKPAADTSNVFNNSSNSSSAVPVSVEGGGGSVAMTATTRDPHSDSAGSCESPRAGQSDSASLPKFMRADSWSSVSGPRQASRRESMSSVEGGRNHQLLLLPYLHPPQGQHPGQRLRPHGVQTPPQFQHCPGLRQQAGGRASCAVQPFPLLLLHHGGERH